ncbi:unnamed protein product [Mesocestoides corti]|uniref:CBF domain-containing protein n=1 Tax=Mesocestoides corti TaxID=53468 RepID=A0A0R3UML5_MESCO|nr:unnamed protein product [Mesocestoides corti]
MPVLRSFYNANIPEDVVKEAVKRRTKQSNDAFKEFLTGLEKTQTNAVVKCLPSIVGLPRRVFLGRLASIGEYITTKKVSTVNLVEGNMSLITDYIDEGRVGAGKRVGTIKKVEALRQLCEVANTPTRLKDLEEWAKSHTSRLYNALIYCLNVENVVVVEEACITIAFLARKLHFTLLSGAENMVTALVSAMAFAMSPTESHAEKLRKALDFHAEMEMAKGRTLEFHFPRLDYGLEEPKFRLIGYVYFTLADFLYNIPHPFLIHYFQCRILRRKEMTRTHLFKIFFAICDNLVELEENAKELCPRVKKPPPKPVTKPTPLLGLDSKKVPPMKKTTGGGKQKEDEKDSDPFMYKPEIYRKEQWDALPPKLYTEMFRAYNDRNPENRNIISSTMTVLRSVSHVKLPAFDASLIQKLEFLNAESLERGNKHIRIATPAKPAENELGNLEESGAVQKEEGNADRPAVTVPTLLDEAANEEVRDESKALSDDSQSLSSSLESNLEVRRNINRPTVLLSRPPDLSKLNL